MTTVTVTTTASTTTTPASRMILRTIDNRYILNFPIAPKEIEYSGFGWTWEEVERDGRQPYLVRNSLALPTISFTAKIVHSNNMEQSVDSELIKLRDMSQSTVPLTIKYGGWLDTWRTWRIDELSFKSIQRHPVTNTITWAEVDISLKSANDIKLTVGPISGGKKSSSTAVKKPTSTKKTSKTRYYKIKKGDTLIKLANRFYGDPNDWKYLAKINKIKNPKKLSVGKKIKY